MSMPGFNAESSLAPTLGTFRAIAAFDGAASAKISAQQLATSAFGRGFDQPMRCCGYSSLLGRYVCTVQWVSPLENCRCYRDGVLPPAIICSGPIVTG
jgi:hypothetical protein